MEILTARPDGMAFNEYRDHLRRQARVRRYPPFVGDTRDLKPI